jgi:hypothetical protein
MSDPPPLLSGAVLLLLIPDQTTSYQVLMTITIQTTGNQQVPIAMKKWTQKTHLMKSFLVLIALSISLKTSKKGLTS